MTVPETTLSHLNRADGSATYSHNGYTIIGAVNGPVEVQRRDEIPEEATIEVNIRPAAGVGTPRERHLETLLHNTLHSIILTRSLPRTLVQITLQVRTLPEEDSAAGINTTLPLLPHLLHTALLALLSAAIPLSTTLTSTFVAIPKGGSALLAPSASTLLRAKPIKSVHVFAFSGRRSLLLNESDGEFSYEEWEEASEMAQEMCCREELEGGVALGGEMAIDGQQGQNLDRWLRDVIGTKAEYEQSWKSAT